MAQLPLGPVPPLGRTPHIQSPKVGMGMEPIVLSGPPTWWDPQCAATTAPIILPTPSLSIMGSLPLLMLPSSPLPLHSLINNPAGLREAH